MLRNARDIKSKLSLLLQASSLIFNYFFFKKEKKSSINQKKTDPSKRCNTHILYHTTKNISKINNIQQPRSTLRCCKKEQH